MTRQSCCSRLAILTEVYLDKDLLLCGVVIFVGVV